ncbi:MAG: hypothetical protein WC624_03660, partial [Candidatus Margulisiibacteriota bacterium]
MITTKGLFLQALIRIRSCHSPLLNKCTDSASNKFGSFMTQGLKGKIFKVITGRPYQAGALLALADIHIEVSDLGKEVSSFSNKMGTLSSSLDHLDALMEQPQLKKSLRILNENLIENPEKMLSSMLEAKMSPAQILKLLLMIHSSFKQGSYPLFHAILPALEAKLTPEQTLELFSNIIEIIKREGFLMVGLKALPDIFKKASETMTSSQIFNLLLELTAKRWAGFAFVTLPPVLDAGMTDRQIIDLFTKISQKTGNGGDDAYYGLGNIFKKAKGMLDLEQMIELLSELIDRFGSESGYSFYAVPDALEARLTPK